MPALPAPVPNDMDITAQVTLLTETVNQLIEYLAAKETQDRKKA